MTRRLFFLFALCLSALVWAQPAANPWEDPPRQDQPVRQFDLKHLKVKLDVDAAKKMVAGEATNTFVPLHRLDTVRFHIGEGVEVLDATLDGRPAETKIELPWITLKAGPMLEGRESTAVIRYRFAGSTPGWHWIEPTADNPSRAGFWTQGQTSSNRFWAPTWDFPNDFATTETEVVAPQDWVIIGNGLMTDSFPAPDGRLRTVWKMDQPHATYLLSLVGGPLDVKEDRWRDKQLLYAVPRGKGHMIEESFGDTIDMLNFFSRRFGVEYPWPKYAQNAMFDFGGGMENVSSSTLGEDSLADPRAGFRTMSSLNAHELAHQWFGDLVTCRHWGETWLNEGWATFGEALYFEHARGATAYQHEIHGNVNSTLNESERYQRPLSTVFFPNEEWSMFDAHSYSKGAAVLHTLRRFLGDDAFFEGARLYLTRHRHEPVENEQFERAMSDASGKDLRRWFDEWVRAPGHPVIQLEWKHENGELVGTITQTQDTSKRIPIYTTIRTALGLVRSDGIDLVPVELTQQKQEVRFPAPAAPLAVLYDPEHTHLRQGPEPNWSREALVAVLANAPHAADRQAAFDQLLAGAITDAESGEVARILALDRGRFPALRSIEPLGATKLESLRAFWRGELDHPDFGRRAGAIQALGGLERNSDDEARIARIASDPNVPYVVLRAATDVLTRWNPERHRGVVEQAMQLDNYWVLEGAFAALVTHYGEEGTQRALAALGSDSLDTRLALLDALARCAPSERTVAALRGVLARADGIELRTAASVAEAWKHPALRPDLEAALARTQQRWVRSAVESALQALAPTDKDIE